MKTIIAAIIATATLAAIAAPASARPWHRHHHMMHCSWHHHHKICR